MRFGHATQWTAGEQASRHLFRSTVRCVFARFFLHSVLLLPTCRFSVGVSPAKLSFSFAYRWPADYITDQPSGTENVMVDGRPSNCIARWHYLCTISVIVD